MWEFPRNTWLQDSKKEIVHQLEEQGKHQRESGVMCVKAEYFAYEGENFKAFLDIEVMWFGRKTTEVVICDFNSVRKK